MRIENWVPEQIIENLTNATHEKLKIIGEVVANNVRLHCPVGTAARPMYVSGRHKGKPWTSRDNGRLKKSIRVVFKKGKPLNVRIYAGDTVRSEEQVDRLAYYGWIVEHDSPFFRPAWNASLPLVKQILGVK